MRFVLLYLLGSISVSHARAQEMKPEVNFLGIDLNENDRGWKVESLPHSASPDFPLAEGDVITKIARHDVARAGPLSIASLLNDAQLHNLPVRIERQGQEKVIQVFTPGSSGAIAGSRGEISLGATLNSVEDTQRIIVTEAVPGSPAQHAGLRKDDELLAIDGTEIGALSPAQIAQRLNDSREQLVHLRIRRAGSELIIILKPTSTSQSLAVYLDAREEQAPAFTLHDLVGKDISLRDFQGKPILLTFWSTSCTPCIAEADLINHLEAEWRPRLVVLALDVDDEPKAVRRFLQARRLSYTVLVAGRFDSPIPKIYGLGALPLTMIIDPKSFIVYLQAGFAPDSPLESRVHTVMGKVN